MTSDDNINFTHTGTKVKDPVLKQKNPVADVYHICTEVQVWVLVAL